MAKQRIIETQIIDKQRHIERLNSNLNDLKKVLSDSDYIRHKWTNFFNSLDWDYFEVDRSDSSPDFILKTKTWDEYFDDNQNKGVFEVIDKPTSLYILPGIPSSNEEIMQVGTIDDITLKADKNKRLMLLSDSLINNFSETLFGWEYCFYNEQWDYVRFTQIGNKFGLLDENRTWFCMIHGELVNRENLHPDYQVINRIWEKKTTHIN